MFGHITPLVFSNNNNSNNNNYGAVIMADHCESSPGSFNECRTAPSGRRPYARVDWQEA